MTPCNEEVTHTVVEKSPGRKMLTAVCGCGKDLGWCTLVGFTEEQAKDELWEWADAHRLGISYGDYIGIREDGEPMTEEEYAPIAALIAGER